MSKNKTFQISHWAKVFSLSENENVSTKGGKKHPKISGMKEILGNREHVQFR